MVIAIIAILAAMLLPALSKAKAKGQGAVCISNMKQLDLAWMLYAGDYSEAVAPNAAGGGQGVAGGGKPAWVAGWLNATASTSDNTNTDLLVGAAYLPYGSIGGYTKSPGIYHCPGDKSADVAYGPRVRSSSMNSFIGPAGPAGSLGMNQLTSGYECYLKTSDFKKLSPVNAVIFLDERASSIDDGWFYISPAGYNPGGTTASITVRNLPAVYHNNCSSFSFADGHAEIHKWISGSFVSLSGSTQSTTYSAGQDGYSDGYWLVSHSTSK